MSEGGAVVREETIDRRPGPRAPDRQLEERVHWALYSGLQRLRGRPVAHCLQQFHDWEKLDPVTLRGLAQQRLREALAFARARVPFYSSGQWERALHRADPTDIRSWPVLDRATVEVAAPELIAQPAPAGLSFRTTSGSTGRPLRFAVEPKSRAWDLAAVYRGWIWHGIAPVARTLRLFSRSEGRFHDWVLNRRVIPVNQLDTDRLALIEGVLTTWQPTLLWSFPSAAFQLARYIRDTTTLAGFPGVPFALLGGEQVFSFQRREVERLLGARVLVSYGASDTAVIATECPAGSMHAFTDHVHIEILREGEPVPAGEFGDIVVTRLFNRAMPLVRYRVGDQGAISPEPCSCGRPLPVLTKLRSRSHDLMQTADDRLIHASSLTEGLDEILLSGPGRAVHQVLFVQIHPHLWNVSLESPQDVDETLRMQLTNLVRASFGAECAVTIERVPRIPREPSGKFRYYRTRVPKRSVPASVAHT